MYPFNPSLIIDTDCSFNIFNQSTSGELYHLWNYSQLSIAPTLMLDKKIIRNKNENYCEISNYRIGVSMGIALKEPIKKFDKIKFLQWVVLSAIYWVFQLSRVNCILWTNPDSYFSVEFLQIYLNYFLNSENVKYFCQRKGPMPHCPVKNLSRVYISVYFSISWL